MVSGRTLLDLLTYAQLVQRSLTKLPERLSHVLLQATLKSLLATLVSGRTLMELLTYAQRVRQSPMQRGKRRTHVHLDLILEYQVAMPPSTGWTRPHPPSMPTSANQYFASSQILKPALPSTVKLGAATMPTRFLNLVNPTRTFFFFRHGVSQLHARPGMWEQLRFRNALVAI